MPIPDPRLLAGQPARGFAAASSQYISYGSAIVTAAPFSVAMWVYVPDTATAYGLWQNANSSVSNNYWSLDVNSGGAGIVSFVARNTTIRRASGPSAVVAGAWAHMGGVAASSANRICYVNGLGGTAETTNTLPNSQSKVSIGAFRADSTPDGYFNGPIAWPCVWNVALNPGEILRLAKGAPPWTIRPQSIVSLVDMKTLYDYAAGAAWTNSGSTLATSPRLAPAKRRSRGFVPAAPTGNRRRRFLILTGGMT